MDNRNYNLMMQSLDTDELYESAPEVEAAVTANVPKVQDISTDMEMRSPRVNLVIDRDKAAAVGLNTSTIENSLFAGFGPCANHRRQRRS